LHKHIFVHLCKSARKKVPISSIFSAHHQVFTILTRFLGPNERVVRLLPSLRREYVTFHPGRRTLRPLLEITRMPDVKGEWSRLFSSAAHFSVVATQKVV